nr:hypothetical protein [uncultured Acetobacterium sp.]
MGKYSEETRSIDLPRSLCEERVLAFDQTKYELKNKRNENNESLIVLHSKIVFLANGQRITILLKEADDNKTEVSIRSELISNVQINDRGMNKKNISVVFGYLGDEKKVVQNQAQAKEADSHSAKGKKKFFALAKVKSDLEMSMMASYLGGYKEFEKSIKGTLEIHAAGIDFAVLGPKFTIPFMEIQAITIASDRDIMGNPVWQAVCFKNELNKSVTDQEKVKMNKLVVEYQSELGLAHCIFRAESSFEVEKSLLKAQGLIEKLMTE